MTRREYLQGKLAKREDWAEKAQGRAEQRLGTAKRLADSIPLGQPLLIGHHSERRHRRDADRIHNNMAKACAEQNLAQHHAACASGIEHQLAHSIFSDDDNAVEALERKIAKAEMRQAHMKAVNGAIRKHAKTGADAQVAALVAIGLADGIARELLKPDYCGRVGFASFELTNNNANIRRMRERIGEIRSRNARHEKAEAAGVLVEGGEYVRVTFPEKPEREILDVLRAAGFMWRQGSWCGTRAKLPASIQSLVATQADTYNEVAK